MYSIYTLQGIHKKRFMDQMCYAENFAINELMWSESINIS